MKDFVIYSKRLAKTLTLMGFTIKATVPNKNKPQFNVYMFEDSQELRSAVQKALRISPQNSSKDI